MANKMLIDAMHPEETRVVTVHGSRVEEFDFEAANRRQLRGNIYLAKVTRVEPSLQAAFVEYGGNRHGFLAFNEIHPDYYQIPLADRQALLEEEARDAEEHREREERRRRSPRRSRGRRAEARARSTDETVSAEDTFEDTTDALQVDVQAADQAPEEAAVAPTGMPDTLAENPEAVQEALASETAAADIAEPQAESAPAGEAVHEAAPEAGNPAPTEAQPAHAATDQDSPAEPEARIAVAEALTVAEEPAEAVAEDTADASGLTAAPVGEADDLSDEEDEESDEEDEDEDESEDDEDESDEDSDEESDDPDAEPKIAQVGGNGDALAEIPERPRHYRRQYKIQEVIKRRQIILVQVVKEERGTKGAALTTYLSLAGRYSVLMPNTGRGGGISRKITSAADRKRLKEVVQDLEVPEGMGVILRTAGASRSKPEIARDFEYLMRLWESVRELTLTSMAPALVYEEGSLIKRAIRDLYNKDLDEVLVAGEDAYREAKDFMRMLMPGQSKVVKPYRDPTPIFARFGVEQQLDAMFSTHVSLKSGGYLVINPTEALVSIDVNSGRATREHDIEDTALKTNLEAAEEVSRQLRLRDLAGLIVIDFIDMEEKRNNRAVEKKLNECLKNDRARIQVGRISPFGLLEMSRQRIRTGVLESSSIPCAHCGGSGFVRATASVALHILRSIEEALLKSASHNLVLRTRTEVALYILNQKRGHLRELEVRFGVTITIAADERLAATAAFQLDRGEPAQRAEGPVTGVRAQAISPTTEFDDEDEEVDEAEAEADVEGEAEEGGAEAREDGSRDEGDGRRRRRRRRRRGGRQEGRSEDERQGGERPEEDDREDGRDEDWEGEDAAEAGEPSEPAPVAAAEAREPDAAVAGPDESARAEDEGGRRRRRGRRGGRGRGEGRTRDAAEAEDAPEATGDTVALSAEEPVSAQAVAEAVEAVPSEGRGETAVDRPVAAAPETSATGGADAAPDRAAARGAEPEPAQEAAGEAARELDLEPAPEPVAVVLTPPADPDRPKRAGWWSRTKAALTGE
ncbi:Rne/Rng family ribonuclease [Methylobacterium mesophilicum SR1.6/6]|uniref:Ribonuclease E n=1 Tax=Methylobacterium mesophilicum SR1.6/6 TaxID=908290 RepID=A0A6B9FKA5_9HYPH|nr:ribonuclease E/G [Methylobacterium mesophilicum]QGY02166.1 Rne/Rng family ribonuclease [Methylobacterium mesophilicum SR1.6/6]